MSAGREIPDARPVAEDAEGGTDSATRLSQAGEMMQINDAAAEEQDKLARTECPNQIRDGR